MVLPRGGGAEGVALVLLLLLRLVQASPVSALAWP
jgi:hypothetical protein